MAYSYLNFMYVVYQISNTPNSPPLFLGEKPDSFVFLLLGSHLLPSLLVPLQWLWKQRSIFKTGP